MLLDVETGRETEVRTPYPVAGTLAWSPDGAKIVCALRPSNYGALLYDINLADGTARALQEYNWTPGHRGGSQWVNAAWHPKRNAVFYATQPLDAPQIWTVDAAGPRIAVQMPLTRYRPEDIVYLHSLSKIPDGSGLIYSADVVNGKGNYELYRVAAEGGKPAPITDTARDEFAPSVSPDGKRIAFFSNRMGNVDLFTVPIGGGEQTHVRLTGLKF